MWCCLALAIVAGIAAAPARAQSVTNLYPGTTSIYLPHVNRPDNGQIGKRRQRLVVRDRMRWC